MFKNKEFNKMALMIALPVMIQQFVMALGQLVDNLMVGQLGENAIAGVGSSNMIFGVIMFMGFGIAEGSSMYLSQQFGSKNYTKMHYTFLVGLSYAIILGISALIFVSIFSVGLLGLFSLDGEALTYGLDYITVVRFTYPLVLINTIMGSSLRVTNRTKVPMYFGIVAIFINTSLNYLLIGGNLGFPRLEVAGAGYATLISRVVELACLASFIIFKKLEFTPKIKDFLKIPLDLALKILKKGIPLLLNEALWSGGMATLMAIYATRGTKELAAIQMSYTVANLLFVVMAGFAVACSILIGQRLGRGELDESRETALKLRNLGFQVGFVVMLVANILAFIVPEFYSVDPSTKALSANILRVLGVFFPAFMISATSFFTLRAGGDVKSVLLMDAAFMWCITIPCALIVTHYTSIHVLFIFICVQLFDIPKAYIGIHTVNKEKWLNNLNDEL